MTTTPRAVRAYLFDPDAATLTVITLPDSVDDPTGHLMAIYDRIDAKTVDAVTLRHDLTAFVDDEALYKPHRSLWTIASLPGVAYVGRAVIVGDAEDGEARAPAAGLEETAALIRLFHAVVVPQLVEIEPVAFGDLGAVISATRVGNFEVQLMAQPIKPAPEPTA
jgi:hypothetical protein